MAHPTAFHAAPADGAESDDEDHLCIICMERPKDTTTLPCGHCMMCHTCAPSVSSSGGSGGGRRGADRGGEEQGEARATGQPPHPPTHLNSSRPVRWPQMLWGPSAWRACPASRADSLRPPPLPSPCAHPPAGPPAAPASRSRLAHSASQGGPSSAPRGRPLPPPSPPLTPSFTPRAGYHQDQPVPGVPRACRRLHRHRGLTRRTGRGRLLARARA
jgi:hypothetical protein